MSRGFSSGLALAVIVAIAVGAIILRQGGEKARSKSESAAPAAPAAPSSVAELERLRAELDRARETVDRLEGELAALRAGSGTPKPPPPEKPAEEVKTLDKIREELKALADNDGVMAIHSGKLGPLVKAFRGHGAAGVGELARLLSESKSAAERFLAAAILEGLADPAAIPALAGALKSDGDDLVRRMASHALAMIGTPDSRTPLREAMSGDRDWGVRVNSAFGLARQGEPDGLKMLSDSYASPQTPQEYRIAVLGGMSQVGHATYAPVFREILSTSRDMTYLLLAIAGLEKAKDASSLPDLLRLSTSDHPEAVRQAALRAARRIRE